MKPVDHLLLGRPLRVIEAAAADVARAVGNCLGRGGRQKIKALVSHAALMPRPSGTAPKGIDVALDRHTVLALMATRYGLSTDELAGPSGISATEQRIWTQIRNALAQAVEETISKLCEGTGLEARSTGPAAPSDQEGQVCWEWQAQVSIQDGEARPLTIGLDRAWSRRLEQRLAARRTPTAGDGAARTTASEAALQVDLTAQLLERTMSAADLHDLRPGTVIPVVMGRAVALLNGVPMLTATVAEHQGKLQLTAFETLE